MPAWTRAWNGGGSDGRQPATDPPPEEGTHMEGLILTAGTPSVLPWGTVSWGTAGLVVLLGAVPLGLAIRNALRNRWQMMVVRLGWFSGGKHLRPRTA